MSEDSQARVNLNETVSNRVSEDRYVGVRALWLKVIIRAIFDWVSYKDSTKLVQKKLAENAHNWLFQPSEMFNGLPNICEQLEIDIDKIRIKAQTMSKEEVAKIEHLERVVSCGDEQLLLEARSEFEKLSLDLLKDEDLDGDDERD